MTSRISLEESRRSTPPVPPGLENQPGGESRHSTPTVPPGLTKPSALPDLEGILSRPSSRPSSRASLRRTTSQIIPALPLRPGTPARATPSRKGTKDEDDIAAPSVEETPTKPPRAKPQSEPKKGAFVQNLPAKPSISAAETEDRILPVDNSTPEPSSISSTLDVVRDVAIVTEKHQKTSEFHTSSASVHDLTASGIQVDLETGDTSSVADSESKAEHSIADAQKRKHPGKLNISAAISRQDHELPETSSTTPTEPGTSSRAVDSSSQTSSKLLQSPSVASPAIKAAPRTLRVVQTPKAETPPPPPHAALPPNFANATHRLPSRQPSVASINPPGTPSSEQISMSDNISLTSTSQSRANSPPPPTSKIGSAPVRAKTKNQLKKERQERAKAIEEEKAKAIEVSEKPMPEEPAQEAIVSRKKKTKKDKEPKLAKAKAAPPAEPALTTSSSLSPRKAPAEITSKAEASPVPKDPQPATPTKSMPPPRQPIPSPSEPSPPPTPTLTAAQLVAELKASAPEIQKCIDSLFRVSNSHHFKTTQNVSHKDLLSGWKTDFNVKLIKDEVDALLTGKADAVYRGGEDSKTIDRHMITPSGAHLRALTKELEARFLELEKALREMPDEFRFRPSKPQNEMKLPSINLEELKRKMENGGGRGVSVMEQMVQDGSTMKKGAFLVDEASKYINEFVMPPATPPPSAGGQARAPSTAPGAPAQPLDTSAPSVEIIERQMNDARRIADEKEVALKKIMKKNKRLLGLA